MADTPPEKDDPHYTGHRARLRARFLQTGGAGLPDYELLELLLFQAIPRRDVKPLAKDLLRVFGSLPRVLRAPKADLEGFGLSEAAIVALKSVSGPFEFHKAAVDAGFLESCLNISAVGDGDQIVFISGQ